ncbi:c-type cytochrome [Lichenicola sp.]|uniref:c-type cytochrome n=1 Tax=Lichenicola sp. TaxID=2804529 RepID=UPI003B002397
MSRIRDFGCVLALALGSLGLSAAAAAQDPSLDVIARGKYLATMGDCTGCHTAEGGKMFAGGQYMAMPFGELSVPNITPDKKTGIGDYTDATFIRLMQRGITDKGVYIYPAMPYAWYATVPKKDLLAIKAYLFSLQPVVAPRQPSKIWFPFNFRPAIALWDALFVPTQEFKPDPKQSDQVNRGAFIVGGLEHCGECHNHRNFLGNTALAQNVLGGAITRWYAPNIRPDNLTGIGPYSVDDLTEFFKKGHSKAMGTVAGPMMETIDDSMQYLDIADLRAVSAYLKSLPPTPSYAPEDATYRPVAMADGHDVYLSHCAACHQANGQGISEQIPALDGNGMVRATGPQDVVRVILGGLEARGPYAAMPGVGAAMSDSEIASVSNYVRQAWSNRAPANTGKLLVSLLREDTHTLLDGSRPGGCPTLADKDLQTVLDDPSNGVATLLHETTEANLLQSANSIIAKVKSAAPQIKQADIVNGLATAYCPVVATMPGLNPDQRVWQLTHFMERVYVQLTTNGTY